MIWTASTGSTRGRRSTGGGLSSSRNTPGQDQGLVQGVGRDQAGPDLDQGDQDPTQENPDLDPGPEVHVQRLRNRSQSRNQSRSDQSRDLGLGPSPRTRVRATEVPLILNSLTLSRILSYFHFN